MTGIVFVPSIRNCYHMFSSCYQMFLFIFLFSIFPFINRSSSYDLTNNMLQFYFVASKLLYRIPFYLQYLIECAKIRWKFTMSSHSRSLISQNNRKLMLIRQQFRCGKIVNSLNKTQSKLRAYERADKKSMYIIYNFCLHCTINCSLFIYGHR